jgi:hypothetical protein
MTLIRGAVQNKKSSVVVPYSTFFILSSDSYIPWKAGSLLFRKAPLITKFCSSVDTSDLTSVGIPRVVALLELRSKTGAPLLLKIFYIRFLEQGYSCGVACRKASHFVQRVLRDSVQRVYWERGVFLRESHLEVLLCSIVFAEVVEDFAQEERIVSGVCLNLEILERVNYIRVVFNWFNSQHCVKWYPRIVYKPILCGLRSRPFGRRGFLSRVSFERPFIALTKAVLQGRKDFLLNFKRNLIVANQFAIGAGCFHNVCV